MKNLRKDLYFTQQEFAALSGVSIPTICQCEKGNRYASEPNKIITEIQLALLQPEPLRAANATKTLTYPSQAGQLARKLKAEEAKVTFAILAGRRMLTRMEEKFGGLSAKMEALQALKKIYKADPRQLMLIGIMEGATEIKLRDCSPVRQLQLRHQLSANEAKQKVIESTLKELDAFTGTEQKR